MLDDSSSVELVEALARAKKALTAELEANLKQLREVLKETERIAQQLEAVLQETQAPVDRSQGSGHGSGGPAHKASAPQPLTGTLGQFLNPIVRATGQASRTLAQPATNGNSHPAGGSAAGRRFRASVRSGDNPPAGKGRGRQGSR